MSAWRGRHGPVIRLQFQSVEDPREFQDEMGETHEKAAQDRLCSGDDGLGDFGRRV